MKPSLASPASHPVHRVELGPWAIELLPGSAYEVRYIARQSAIGFAFDSQRGIHAIGSDRMQPFHALPNGLAFVPAGCDVYSTSAQGGEYLRVVRTDGVALQGDRAFNDVIDQQAVAVAKGMRAALLKPCVSHDWEGWAHALAGLASGAIQLEVTQGSMTRKRLHLLDDFIHAGLHGPLTVPAMAGLLGLSEGFFIRAFKRAVGQSPHSYVLDCRLARARELLGDRRQRLVDIALACGFASQAHMATAFRHRLGVTPTELR